VLPELYKARDFRPIWCAATGPRSLATDLLDAIRDAEQHALIPYDYHLDTLTGLMDDARFLVEPMRRPDTEFLADLDVLLTDAFLMYASHLFAGRVNPETIHTEWVAHLRRADLVRALEGGLASGRMKEALEQLAPPHRGYAGLRRHLTEYRRIVAAGGWPTMPDGPSLRPGDVNPHVSVLRQRLRITGDLTTCTTAEPQRFDPDLEAAVRRFQGRHGLEVDGVVGRRTRAALNVTAEARVRQIELNMERWRWLPHDLGPRHVLVNIAEYQLTVVESGSDVVIMRAIVGADHRRTPVFTGTMTYLVINPFWNIPPRIARQDILPRVRADVGYLREYSIRVLADWRADAPEIDPETIDWSRVSAARLPFRFRQDPGPANALGRIKFMFPNKFHVYLHDTPTRDLFARVRRGFSSGCIRVERPLELAEFVLRDDPVWDREAITDAIDSGQRHIIPVPDPLPVHLLYWTASVNDRGLLHFRDDIYDRDRPLHEALQERPPTA
jgi:murein L,D-transpeptidase YcbB/YkuD